MPPRRLCLLPTFTGYATDKDAANPVRRLEVRGNCSPSPRTGLFNGYGDTIRRAKLEIIERSRVADVFCEEGLFSVDKFPQVSLDNRREA